MKLLISFVLAVFLSPSVFGQSAEDSDVKILYEHELSFGGGLHALGWTGFANYAKVKPGNRKQLFQLEFMEVRHQKEAKLTSEYNLDRFGYDPPRQYVYGKINNFYALHLSSGTKRVLGEKADKNGVEIQYLYMFGASLGIQKPYYLELIELNDSPQGFDLIDQKYEGDTSNNFLDKIYIYGSSGFSKGLSEVKFIPGIHAKAALNFDWGYADDFIKSVEVGIMTDFYFKQVDLMALENNKPVFFSLFLTLQFGKRW